MANKLVRKLEITSPTFESFTKTLYKDNRLNLRKTFIRHYPLKEAQYIDEKFENFYKTLNSIAKEESKKTLKEFKQTFKNHFFGEIIRELMPLKKITNESPESVHVLIENAFHKLFFYADLIIVFSQNDYNHMKKIQKWRKRMGGKPPLKPNLILYREIIRIHDSIDGYYKDAVRKLIQIKARKELGNINHDVFWNIEEDWNDVTFLKVYYNFKGFRKNNDLNNLQDFENYNMNLRPIHRI